MSSILNLVSGSHRMRVIRVRRMVSRQLFRIEEKPTNWRWTEKNFAGKCVEEAPHWLVSAAK